MNKKGKTKKSIKKDTTIVNAGRHPEENFGVLNPPVYHASTIMFSSLEEYEAKDDNPYAIQYGRTGTPTTFAFEEAVTELHEGFATIALPSGLAAIACAMTALLKKGDHALIPDNVYGPTRHRVAKHVLGRAGVDVTYYDPLIGKKIDQLIRPETKLIYMESPGSVTFEVQDIQSIVSICKKSNIITLMDNTWASPYFLQPITLGIDIVIEAATKYIVGHSDVMMGIVTVNNDEHFRLIKYNANAYGYHAAPDDCYLAARGLRTLSVRLERHQKNATEVASWLMGQDEVEHVLYPALPTDKGHALWKRDFKGASGLFSVVLDKEFSRKSFARMLDSFKFFPIGASWGGYESLCLPVDLKKIRTVSPVEFGGYVLRLHIGLENTGDLIEDLQDGLKRLSAS